MNNYSISQQVLHRLALSSNFLKEVCFDFEKMFFYDVNHVINDNHVFISGMARSGTTILLNAIYNTKEFASLTYEDMPFILAPNIWFKINKGGISLDKQERVHEDGIKINTNSPEAFEEVFWKTFNYDDDDTSLEFKKFICLLCLKYNKRRYLSKNNQNIRRIDKIIEHFPKSKVIIPFREPLQHSFSLLNQHNKFKRLQSKDDFIRKYMFWIGHSEFGIDYDSMFKENTVYNDYNSLNHWLEQWLLCYHHLKQYENILNIKFICYEDLCNRSQVWESLLNFIGIEMKDNFDFCESKKEISISYDDNLYSKCKDLYREFTIITK